MKPMKQILLENLEEYKYYRKLVERKKIKKVRGSLAVSINNGKIQYYHLTSSQNNKKKRTYIKEDEMDLAKNLVNQAYVTKFEKLVNLRIKQMEAMLKDFEDFELQNLFDNLPTYKKTLIKAIGPSHEAYIKEWEAKEYQPKKFADGDLVIMTNRGERVRSKSEKILADKFNDLGINYKYEKPLILEDGTKLYPDFTFISPYTREEIYWEHHGMMDNPNYVMNTMKKIETYENNGIFRNEKLIVTYESSGHNLNYEWVDILIRKHLI